MEALKYVPYLFLMLAVTGIVAGAGILALGQMGNTVADKCYNSSWKFNTTNLMCQNQTGIGDISAGRDGLNFSDSYYGLMEAQKGSTTVAQQFPTIGIIAVMVIIIALIAGVMTYFAYFR